MSIRRLYCLFIKQLCKWFIILSKSHLILSKGPDFRIQPASRKDKVSRGGDWGDQATDATGVLLFGQGQEVQAVPGSQGDFPIKYLSLSYQIFSTRPRRTRTGRGSRRITGSPSTPSRLRRPPRRERGRGGRSRRESSEEENCQAPRSTYNNNNNLA